MISYEQWIVDQEAELDEQIDRFIEEDAELLPTTQRPTRMKQERHRKKEELKNSLTLVYLKNDIDLANQIIFSRMPQFLSSEEWESVSEELLNCENSVKKFWEECQGGDHQEPVAYYQILGLSSETLLHLYHFGQDLLENEEIVNSQAIFGFLVIIAPQIAPFWLALGRTYQFSGNYIEAVEVYEQGKAYDVKLGRFYLFSAECYEAMDNEKAMNEEIATLRELIADDPENQVLWDEAQEKFN